MNYKKLNELFNLSSKTAVITGGGGVLCGLLAVELAKLDVKVAVLDLTLNSAQETVAKIEHDGGEAIAVACNVLDKDSIIEAHQRVMERFQKVDILVNGAGGNNKLATTSSHPGRRTPAGLSRRLQDPWGRHRTEPATSSSAPRLRRLRGWA